MTELEKEFQDKFNLPVFDHTCYDGSFYTTKFTQWVMSELVTCRVTLKEVQAELTHKYEEEAGESL